MKVDGIHRQSTFRALRKPDVRSSSGPIRVFYVRSQALCGDEKMQVAYSIGRSFGKAVVRNKCRRRLRSTVYEIRDGLARGAYLVTVSKSAADLSYDELASHMRKAIRTTSGRAGIREDKR
ncbi:MAG: ribonuclease P protein component [Acidimicrobiales bacterium]|jgi:ribonuclease P protein component